MAVTKKSCPHCKEEIEIETKEPKRIEVPVETNTQQLQVLQKQIDELKKPAPEPPKEEKKKLTHDEIAEMIPPGVNYSTCPGGDCGHMKLKNPKQTKKWKTCDSGKCESNMVAKDAPCPGCGKQYDEDTWKELEDGNIIEEEEKEVE